MNEHGQGDAAAKAFHCETAVSLRAHVQAFLSADTFAKHLEALRWRTPFQAVRDARAKDPAIFKVDPHHLIPGNTHAREARSKRNSRLNALSIPVSSADAAAGTKKQFIAKIIFG